jgi:aminomethyltransferase
MVHLRDVRAFHTLFYGYDPNNCYPAGAQIYSPVQRELIGTVTSGISSPTLGENIAMGYVKSGFHKKGTEVDIDVRSTLRKAVVTPLPFIQPSYWRG